MASRIRDYNPHLGTKDELVQSYSGFIYKMANRFRWAVGKAGIGIEDLVNEAWIGLFTAYDRFDPIAYGGEATAFTTYSFPFVSGAIRRFVRDRGTTVKISRSIYELTGHILKKDLADSSAFEIADQLGCEPKAANEALKYLRDSHAMYFDGPSADSGDKKSIPLYDQVKTKVDWSEIEVTDFIERLPAREQRMVSMRLAGLSLSAIGTSVGISQPQAGRIMRSIGDQFQKYFYISESEVIEMNGELTKQKYQDYKKQKYSDVKVCEIFEIGSSQLYRLKKQWGLVISPKATSVVKPPVTPAADPTDQPLTTVYRDRIDGRIEQLVSQVEHLAKENQLLKSLLKNYL